MLASPPRSLGRLHALAALAACAWLVGCAGAGVPATERIDFAEADPWSVHVVTLNEGGGTRVTRIWIVPWQGGAAIRTSGTRWQANIARGSATAIRMDGVDHPVDVDFVTNLELRRQIDDAFLTKYGWQERLVIGSDRAESDDHYMKLTPLAGR